jgi:hypothetical protein
MKGSLPEYFLLSLALPLATAPLALGLSEGVEDPDVGPGANSRRNEMLIVSHIPHSGKIQLTVLPVMAADERGRLGFAFQAPRAVPRMGDNMLASEESTNQRQPDYER